MLPEPQPLINFESVSLQLHTLYMLTNHAIHEDVLAHHDKIRARFERPEDYLLFHILIGGSVPERCYGYDFPGEYSVENFLREKLLPYATN